MYRSGMQAYIKFLHTKLELVHMFLEKMSKDGLLSQGTRRW